MTNEKLKQELKQLKSKIKIEDEKKQLENELKILKEKTRKKSTLEKIGKMSLKGLLAVGKMANNYAKNQEKKLNKQNKK